MQHITYANADTYSTALLIKNAAFNKQELDKAYTLRLQNKGIDQNDIVFMSLDYNENGKAPVKFIKAYLEQLLPALDSIGVKILYCADANYFKVLAKQRKAEPHLGYTFPCAIEGYEHMTVILGINHKALMHNPANEPKLALSLDTLADTLKGTPTNLGKDIIHRAAYPETEEDIQHALATLHQYPELSIDIEGFSLKFDQAQIATISFCWSKHEGIAFACDYHAFDDGPDDEGNYGEYRKNSPVRRMIAGFLDAYTGKTIWHNAPYDMKSLIFNLWMGQDFTDTNNLLIGLERLTENFHDTKIISYLATNSTAGNELSLKAQAHEFAGNWAQDEIKDIRKIPLDELLQYNLIDGLATHYVLEKNYPKMVADDQEDLYYSLMLPSQKTIIQIEMEGMPLDPERVLQVKAELQGIVAEQLAIFDQSPIIQQLNARLQREEMEAANAKLKIKQHPLSHFADVKFNPNSDPQKVKLIYQEMGLPVLYKTKGKQPSTKGVHLDIMVNHTENPDYLEVLEALTTYTTAEKVLTAFIPAFERAVSHRDDSDIVWLHGNFNLNGTVSGRLSSSDPNLQNIPSGSKYAELIKSCFVSPPGWIFSGADFTSLEDYISALTTKDPNKLKVYLEGYDGHCLRAFSYFPDELPGIVDTLESINSIKVEFPKVRKKSKNPTFALTYQGTWITLHKNLGFSKDEAKQIEHNYHELYEVSDAWVQAKLDEANKKGYVTLAFGLRLRTPLLAQVVRGHRTTPYEAEAEGRTAGNALGQGYGLLNNRAAVEFMEKVWASPYRFDIKPIALIHDASYLLIRDRLEVIKWVNRELIASMEWQELPEIQHDTVKLGAELSLFWPHWGSELVLPNNCSPADIVRLSQEHLRKLSKKDEAA